MSAGQCVLMGSLYVLLAGVDASTPRRLVPDVVPAQTAAALVRSFVSVSQVLQQW